MCLLVNYKKSINRRNLFFSNLERAIPVSLSISEKWDSRAGTVSGTRVSRLRANLVHISQDARPRTLMVGTEKQDSGPNS